MFPSFFVKISGKYYKNAKKTIDYFYEIGYNYSARSKKGRYLAYQGRYAE